ncbi:hypothetical protein C8Q74DRAFT_266586 [Fomes fomentarius]|nr:hypothetical protein C8Q74DRAFT_266586 [Fomes fomentarius]
MDQCASVASPSLDAHPRPHVDASLTKSLTTDVHADTVDSRSSAELAQRVTAALGRLRLVNKLCAMRAPQSSQRIRRPTQTLRNYLPASPGSASSIDRSNHRDYCHSPNRSRIPASLHKAALPKSDDPHPTSIRVRTLQSPFTPITVRGRRVILRFCRRTERGQDRASPPCAGPGGLASEQKVRHGRLSGQKARENPSRDAQDAAKLPTGSLRSRFGTTP